MTMMTRDEFDDWLEERRECALDDAPQGDATPQTWIARLYAMLKNTADEEARGTAEEEDDEVEDSLDEYSPGVDDEEEDDSL